MNEVTPSRPSLIAAAATLLASLVSAQDAPRSTSVVALVGGSIIDGTGKPAKPGTLVIRGERITAVGADADVPAEAEVIEVSGKTLIPGLVDMHGHYYGNVGGKIVDLFEVYALLYLAGGVTTTFSPGDHDPGGMLDFRDRVREGRATGPRILAGGPYIDHAPSAVSWIAGVSDARAATEKVERWAARVDAFKVYTRITEPELTAVIEAAHRAKRRVVGHLNSITAGRAIELGIDGLEHGVFAMSELARHDPKDYFELSYYQQLARLDLGSAPVRRLIQAIVDNGVVIDPTVVVMQIALTDMKPVAPDIERYIDAEVLARVRRQRLMQRRLTRRHGDAWPEAVSGAIRTALGFVKRVHDAGGIVVAGTDPVGVELLPGYGLHRELANFVDAGLTPLQALAACSRNAAKALGLDDELGTLEPGKRADVVVLEGNPAEDIAALGRTLMVFRDGVRYDPEVLRKQAEGRIR